MKTSLIINFRRIGDIISNSHLISELKEEGHKVSILIYKEFEAAAQVLEGVDNIFTIDRKKIETYVKSELFHDAMALDTLYRELSPCLEKTWDQVINISNDTLGTRVASFIGERNRVTPKGLSFKSNQLMMHSSPWSVVYNDIIPKEINSPVHFQDIYHQIALNRIYTPSLAPKLKISQRYEQQTIESFKNIRENYGKTEIGRIVGIQAKTSNEEKDIPFSTIVETIELIKQEKPDWIPLIILAPNDKERELANRLNLKFNNSLVSVEANLTALPSVVKNLDTLITPDTAIKHFADVFNVPTLEISLGKSPLFKQASIGLKSAILTQRIDHRQERPGKDRHLLEARDIVNAVNYIMTNSNIPTLSKGKTLYRLIHDSFGMRYVAVAGDISVEKEVYRVLSRDYIARLLGNPSGVAESFIGFKELYGEELRNYLEKEKTEITQSMKSLLATLRSIAKAKEPGASSRSLIGHLDHLFELSEESNLSAICLKFFRVRIENLEPNTSKTENLKCFEDELFNLKDDMQVLLKVIHDFEKHCTQKESNFDVRLRNKQNTTV